VLAIEPFNHERPEAHERSGQVQRDHLTLPQRLGYAVLLHANYGTAVLMGPGDEPVPDSVRLTASQVEMEFSPNDDEPDFECIGTSEDLDVPGAGSISVRALTIALVAAERYNRNSFNRALEGRVARLSLGIRGTLPDYTYGVAQIRASTARRLVRSELGGYALKDGDLLALLLNDCQNLRLAGRYVRQLVLRYHDAGDVDGVIARVAAHYNGMATPTLNGLLYTDAVIGAYHLIAKDVPGEEPGAGGGPASFCIHFALGGGEGDTSTVRAGVADRLRGRSPVPTDTVQITVTSQDPGPAAYVQRLDRERREWIAQQAQSLGFAASGIHFVPANARQAQADCAEGRPDSFAEVVVRPDSTLMPRIPPPPPPPPPAAPRPAAAPVPAAPH
jgi:hypothetical protein